MGKFKVGDRVECAAFPGVAFDIVELCPNPKYAVGSSKEKGRRFITLDDSQYVAPPPPAFKVGDIVTYANRESADRFNVLGPMGKTCTSIKDVETGVEYQAPTTDLVLAKPAFKVGDRVRTKDDGREYFIQGLHTSEFGYPSASIRNTERLTYATLDNLERIPDPDPIAAYRRPSEAHVQAAVGVVQEYWTQYKDSQARAWEEQSRAGAARGMQLQAQAAQRNAHDPWIPPVKARAIDLTHDRATPGEDAALAAYVRDAQAAEQQLKYQQAYNDRLQAQSERGFYRPTSDVVRESIEKSETFRKLQEESSQNKVDAYKRHCAETAERAAKMLGTGLETVRWSDLEPMTRDAVKRLVNVPDIPKAPLPEYRPTFACEYCRRTTPHADSQAGMRCTSCSAVYMGVQRAALEAPYQPRGKR